MRTIPPMGNIPPNIRGNIGISIGRIGKKTVRDPAFTGKKVHYTKMRTQTLKELLSYAEGLKEKFLIALQTDNSDKNIEKFDKLEQTIKQLRQQITVREGGVR